MYESDLTCLKANMRFCVYLAQSSLSLSGTLGSEGLKYRMEELTSINCRVGGNAVVHTQTPQQHSNKMAE